MIKIENNQTKVLIYTEDKIILKKTSFKKKKIKFKLRIMNGARNILLQENKNLTIIRRKYHSLFKSMTWIKSTYQTNRLLFSKKI